MNPHELTGSVALVTGAGRNIGRAIALELAAAGAAVVINARSNHEETQTVAREIIAQGGKGPSFPGGCRRRSRSRADGDSGHPAFRPYRYSGQQRCTPRGNAVRRYDAE
jgi:NAD(P)-dependent dehydrogenase (short-subunit alcohol dehydrogenase family)